MSFNCEWVWGHGGPEAGIQENAERKAAWLTEAKRCFPVGSMVRIVASDQEAYIGQRGAVDGYDTGADGDWPLVSVRLASGTVDGFYEDEVISVALCGGEE
jgi:hypothetical protein